VVIRFDEGSPMINLGFHSVEAFSDGSDVFGVCAFCREGAELDLNDLSNFDDLRDAQFSAGSPEGRGKIRPPESLGSHMEAFVAPLKVADVHQGMKRFSQRASADRKLPAIRVSEGSL